MKMIKTAEPKVVAVYTHAKLPNVFLVECENAWYRVPKKYRGWNARERVHGEIEKSWMLVRTHSPPAGICIPLRGRKVPEAGTTLTDRMIAARQQKAGVTAEDDA